MRADFGWEDLGSSRPGPAQRPARPSPPPLRALRIAAPLRLAHRRAKLLHRARLPYRKALLRRVLCPPQRVETGALVVLALDGVVERVRRGDTGGIWLGSSTLVLYAL